MNELKIFLLSLVFCINLYAQQNGDGVHDYSVGLSLKNIKSPGANIRGLVGAVAYGYLYADLSANAFSTGIDKNNRRYIDIDLSTIAQPLFFGLTFDLERDQYKKVKRAGFGLPIPILIDPKGIRINGMIGLVAQLNDRNTLLQDAQYQYDVDVYKQKNGTTVYSEDGVFNKNVVDRFFDNFDMSKEKMVADFKNLPTTTGQSNDSKWNILVKSNLSNIPVKKGKIGFNLEFSKIPTIKKISDNSQSADATPGAIIEVTNDGTYQRNVSFFDKAKLIVGPKIEGKYDSTDLEFEASYERKKLRLWVKAEYEHETFEVLKDSLLIDRKNSARSSIVIGLNYKLYHQ